MTTIAWDGKTLAADRQLTCNDRFVGEVIKVFRRKDGVLIGVAGETCLASGLARWFMKGEKGKSPLFKDEDRTASAIVIRKNGKAELHYHTGYYEVEGRASLGSGDELALLAMDLGCGAEEAIKWAAKYDNMTNSVVDTVTQDACT